MTKRVNGTRNRDPTPANASPPSRRAGDGHSWAGRRIIHGMACLPTLPLRTTMLLTALALSACGGSSDSGYTPPQGFEEIAAARLDASWYAQWPVRQYVARTTAEWQAIWDEPVSVGNPQPPLPSVDFAVNAVVGVSMGWGGCDFSGIKHVYRRGTDYIAAYGTTRLPPGAACAGVVTPDVSFVLVPQPVATVQFVRTDE